MPNRKVNRTRKVVRKGKKMSGGNRKVNRTRKVAGRSRKVAGRSRKMVGGKRPKNTKLPPSLTTVGRAAGRRQGRNGMIRRQDAIRGNPFNPQRKTVVYGPDKLQTRIAAQTMRQRAAAEAAARTRKVANLLGTPGLSAVKEARNLSEMTF
jgi:hypothetical protein